MVDWSASVPNRLSHSIRRMTVSDEFDDTYLHIAEFWDELSRPHWEHIAAEVLTEGLVDADPSAGPVLDLGAGTGQATAVVARALPQARIIATEPSLAMRIALTNRVAHDPDLRHRVTVLPDRAQDVELPNRLCAVVGFGMIGHLDRADRQRLWQRLTERLPPGAPVVLELMALSTPQVVAPFRIAREVLGEQVYELWMRGEPGRDDVMRYASTFTVSRNGRVVRRIRLEHDWLTFGTDQLAVESGMSVRKLTNEIVVLTR